MLHVFLQLLRTAAAAVVAYVCSTWCVTTCCPRNNVKISRLVLRPENGKFLKFSAFKIFRKTDDNGNAMFQSYLSKLFKQETG